MKGTEPPTKPFPPSCYNKYNLTFSEIRQWRLSESSKFYKSRICRKSLTSLFKSEFLPPTILSLSPSFSSSSFSFFPPLLPSSFPSRCTVESDPLPSQTTDGFTSPQHGVRDCLDFVHRLGCFRGQFLPSLCRRKIHIQGKRKETHPRRYTISLFSVICLSRFSSTQIIQLITVVVPSLVWF